MIFIIECKDLEDALAVSDGIQQVDKSTVKFIIDTPSGLDDLMKHNLRGYLANKATCVLICEGCEIDANFYMWCLTTGATVSVCKAIGTETIVNRG